MLRVNHSKFRQMRLDRMMTVSDLAIKSAVSLTTVKRLESGGPVRLGVVRKIITAGLGL